ncbi:Kinesin-1-like protein, partial [Nymphaea thermarum]
TKQIRIVSKVSYSKERKDPENVEKVILKHGDACRCKSGSMNRIIKKLRQYLKEEHVNLLEEMSIMEVIIFDPSNSTEDLESVSEETDGQTISVLSNEVELLLSRVEKLTRENAILKAAAASHPEFSIQSALHLLCEFKLDTCDSVEIAGAVIGDGWKTALLPFQWVSVCTWALIRDSWRAATLPVWWARWAADSLFGRAMPKKRF